MTPLWETRGSGGTQPFLWGGGNRYGHFYLKNETC